jgi:glycosyltransferase involved in cell wall biosynthesis
MIVPMSVSVVMPAKNAAAHLREAVESVFAQGSAVHELIIVDDGSTDDTVSLVRSLSDSRIRLLSNARTGVSAARNLGAQMATGTWLMFLDADDRLRPGAVATLTAGAQVAPDAILVYGDYDLIDGEGRPIGRRGLLKGRRKPSGQVLERLAAGNFIVNGGIAIIRADAFDKAGGFDESLRYCEDWHCWCRLAATGEFQFVSALLLDYRIHAASTMSAAMRSPKDFFPAVEAVFSDDLIINRLPAASVPRLRCAAEVHLLTYSAAQATRFRRYREAFSYIRMVARKSLLSTPRALMSLSLAYAGI